MASSVRSAAPSTGSGGGRPRPTRASPTSKSQRRWDGLSLLSVEEVSVRFGGVMALQDVELTADPGCVTGLIGPNGAGKTTLFNVITGLQDPTAGKVVIDGQDVSGMKAHQRARLG